MIYINNMLYPTCNMYELKYLKYDMREFTYLQYDMCEFTIEVTG